VLVFIVKSGLRHRLGGILKRRGGKNVTGKKSGS
jgi:hypothetical protein